MTVGGVGLTLVTATGAAAIPRSGFPGAALLGPLLILRARELRR